MCPSPTSRAFAASAVEKAADSQSAEIQDESFCMSEERVLSAGLFAPEEDSASDMCSSQTQTLFTIHDDLECLECPAAQTKSGGVGIDPQSAPAHACHQASRGQTPHDSTRAEQQKDVFTFEETLIVFDFDDTLLPSTWLRRQQLQLDVDFKMSTWQREQLAAVEAVAIELICQAKQCGTVVLITNAERGWIEVSCHKFFPALLPLLENVKCVSAQSMFKTTVSSPLEWKLLAFGHEINLFYGKDALLSPESRKNVLSLGDSPHEREALIRATSQLPSCYAKSFKFVDRPNISQLINQQKLVNNCFHEVVHHVGHIDTCIQGA